jgi:hypothetical protein
MNTFTIKGFVNYPLLFASIVGDTATVGELSKVSYSYAPDIQPYDNVGSYPNVALLAFFMDQDGTTIPVPQLLGDYALQAVTWVMQQALLGNFTSSGAAFIQALSTQYSTTMSAISAGNMINFNSTLYCPEWIQYTQSTGDGNTNTVKLWLCDASFQAQYDLYTIRVIPPVTNVDDLFAGYTSVSAELADFDIPTLMQRIQASADEQPYTLLRSYNFNYVNQANTNQTLPTVWSVIEYGIAGDNTDSIKAAIVSYILANSQYTQAQWSLLIPELFLSTEFIVTPLWDQYAIPNGGLEPGIYSPNVSYGDSLYVAQQTAQGPGYTSGTVVNSLNIVPFQYKSLTLEFVSGPLNTSTDASIQSLFPDYINIPSTSVDFARMSTTTQEWVTFINNMLVLAETMTESTVLPTPVTGGPTYERIIRNNLYYLSATFNSIQYLMVPLAQLQALIGLGVVGQSRVPVSSLTGSGS